MSVVPVLVPFLHHEITTRFDRCRVGGGGIPFTCFANLKLCGSLTRLRPSGRFFLTKR